MMSVPGITAADSPLPSARLARWLCKLSAPHFGVLVTYILLGASVLLLCLPLATQPGDRQPPASVLGLFIPPSLIGRAEWFWLFRAVLAVGIVLWGSWRMLPYSPWLVVIGFTGLWSIHVENVWHTSHCFQVVNHLLFVQALWMTAMRKEISAALARREFFQAPVYPHWVTVLAVAYLGLFHTAAGVSKLAFSGWGWADGTSLQLWTYMWGRRSSPSTQLILASQQFTKWLQVGTLVFETAGILAVWPVLRPWIGITLCGFYVGVLATFDYGFQLNLLLTALYLLPFESWIEKRFHASLPSA